MNGDVNIFCRENAFWNIAPEGANVSTPGAVVARGGRVTSDAAVHVRLDRAASLKTCSIGWLRSVIGARLPKSAS